MTSHPMGNRVREILMPLSCGTCSRDSLNGEAINEVNRDPIRNEDIFIPIHIFDIPPVGQFKS